MLFFAEGLAFGRLNTDLALTAIPRAVLAPLTTVDVRVRWPRITAGQRGAASIEIVLEHQPLLAGERH